ncbi:MAG TPA: tetratricopeptide repeat protein [Myxococcota bacterium]|jgi:tetratricopeptide (TPR) repeat protein|nr:tetratricopeptide repeat protein [Myxococcota bacterium]
MPRAARAVLVSAVAALVATACGPPHFGSAYRPRPSHSSAALYDPLGDSVAFIRMMIDHGKRKEVERRYWAKLVRGPDDAEARLLYALTLDDGPDATRLVDAALEQEPDLYWAHVVRGEMLARGKRWPDAAAEFERALAINGNVADAHLGLARVLRGTARVDEARAVYRDLAESHPENATVFAETGDLLRGLGEKGGAVEAYRRAVTLDPERYAALMALADLYLEAGDRDRALEFSERASEVNATSLAANLMRARLYKELKLVKEMVAAYEKALRGAPDAVAADAALRHEIGMARGPWYVARDDWGTAAEAYAAAAAASPDDVEAWKGLARARAATDDLTGALDAWARARALRPGDSGIVRAHEELLARVGAAPGTAHGGKTDAEVVASVRASVQKCWEKQLFYFPSLAGTLSVALSVDAAGKVTAASIDGDSMGSPEVAACARFQFLGATFPAGAPGEKKFDLTFGKAPKK